MDHKKYLLLLLSMFFVTQSFAGINDSGSKFTLTGYVDAYFAYYTDSIGHSDYQKFPTVSPRSNQLGLNIASLTADYNGDNIRGTLTIHYGDIPRSTWSGTLNYIQEAHAGIKLMKKLWLDAGLFRTHFGTEGLLPKENITSSVAVGTFYEPYYEAGARLNFVPNDKLAISVYLINGYNIYEENNNKKSVGALVTYTLSESSGIGYSNYLGDDTPDEADSVKHTRLAQNLFFNWQKKKLKVQLGVDYVLQSHSQIMDADGMASMYSGVASIKYQFAKKFAIYARGEVFNDPDGFMSFIMKDTRLKMTGLKLWGATGGLEVQPSDNSYLRIEARRLKAEDAQKIFRWDGHNESSRMEITVNLGVTIQ